MSSNPPFDPTVAYYDAHADEYAEATVGLDMTPLYEPFLALVPPGGHILDAGCGSGRDSLAFLWRGYRVTAVDASAELARRASLLIGQQVKAIRFQQLAFDAVFDGVWACASLLHVRRAELPDVFGRLVASLRPSGVLCCSFKEGAGQGERDGRWFTDFTPDQLFTDLGGVRGLGDVRVWTTADVRPGEARTTWVNALARKVVGERDES